MKENIGGAAQLKENKNQYVNPRNNHHVLIYENEQGELKEEVVTFWEVVERKRTGMDTYRLPDDGVKIITAIHTNDMYILGIENESIDWININYEIIKNHLYRVQKTTSGVYTLVLHNASGINVDKYKFDELTENYPKVLRISKSTYDFIKVKITSSGKLEKS